MQKNEERKPAWRQFWFWFVLAPPLASVVMGVSLVTLAVSGEDSRVVDNYYQAGRSIHKDFERERQAAELGLDATVAVDRENGQVTIRMGGELSAENLNVRLAHATHADRDRDLTVTRDDTGLYRGRIGQPVTGRHYLRLEPPDGDWRLTAVLDNGQNQVDAVPGLPGDEGD